jgi:mono/diheme cytochrome c family protein
MKAMTDPDPQVRKAAVWISESFLEKNDEAIINSLAALKSDTSADVRVQLSLSLRGSNNAKAQTILQELLAENKDNQMIRFSSSIYAEAKKTAEEEARRTKNLSPADRKLVTDGALIYKQLCSSCHGMDGKGITIGGGPMPAPPLAGSPRVRGDKIMLTQLLLLGLQGPVDGKTYPNTMPAMKAQDDQWIASVLSYIRNSSELGNKSSVVTEAEVKKIRAESPKDMGSGFTIQLLEIFKLGRAERTNWDKKK